MSLKNRRKTGLLLWQFLIATILLYSVASIHVIRKYGHSSPQFVFALILMGLVTGFIVIPYLRELRGPVSIFRKTILSLMFSLSIILTPMSLFISVRYRETTTVAAPSRPSPVPVFVVVEFRLIPYARVYDVTDKRAKRFLLESHYKEVKLRQGRHVLRFDYGNRSYTKTINAPNSGRYVLFFDLRAGRFHFKRIRGSHEKKIIFVRCVVCHPGPCILRVRGHA
jgi:hypothetical protein